MQQTQILEGIHSKIRKFKVHFKRENWFQAMTKMYCDKEIISY